MTLAPRAFWMVAGLVLVANLSVGAVVQARVGQAALHPVEIHPTPGATGVSTVPAIRVAFRRAMDPASLRTALRLEPATAGTVEADELGATFVPDQPLASQTRYSVVLDAGARALSGAASTSEVRTTFQTRAARLIVIRRDAPGWGLWAVDPTTGSGRHIVAPWADPGEAGGPPATAVAPDGEEVAYVVRAVGPRWSLWAASVQAGTARPILQDEDGAVASVRWSPRGDLLAYEHSLIFGALTQDPKLWVVSADGSQSALIYGRGDESGSNPVWAPDGRRLAFYETRLRAIGIFSFTGTLRSIAANVPQQVTWSPDGAGLAYVNRPPDQPGAAAIEVASIDEPSRAGRPLHDTTAIEWSPAWSPDGSRIAFYRISEEGGGIWISSLSGGESRVLVQDRGWAYGRPVWAPDGSAVAFSRQPLRAGPLDAEPELWIAPLDGAPRRLDRGGWLAAWAP